jgi:hypothetical protein
MNACLRNAGSSLPDSGSDPSSSNGSRISSGIEFSETGGLAEKNETKLESQRRARKGEEGERDETHLCLPVVRLCLLKSLLLGSDILLELVVV